jgi:hypothetical protein
MMIMKTTTTTNEEMAPRTWSIASEPKAMVVVGEEARALNAWAA